MVSLPLRHVRLAFASVTFVLAVISGAAGINALVKSNQEVKDIVRVAATLDVIINVNTNDLDNAGIVLTVAMLLLILLSGAALLAILYGKSTSLQQARSSRMLLLQFGLYIFISVWIFACAIPVSLFSANRSAQVHAFFPGGIPIPDSIVLQTEAQLGFSRVYWPHPYVKFFAIVPWFAFIAAVGSTAATFIAWRTTDTPIQTDVKLDNVKLDTDTEMGSVRKSMEKSRDELETDA